MAGENWERICALIDSKLDPLIKEIEELKENVERLERHIWPPNED